MLKYVSIETSTSELIMYYWWRWARQMVVSP